MARDGIDIEQCTTTALEPALILFLLQIIYAVNVPERVMNRCYNRFSSIGCGRVIFSV